MQYVMSNSVINQKQFFEAASGGLGLYKLIKNA